jgi:hypothetical protein
MAADFPPHPLIGRFWAKADNGGLWPAMVCSLLTDIVAKRIFASRRATLIQKISLSRKIDSSGTLV